MIPKKAYQEFMARQTAPCPCVLVRQPLRFVVSMPGHKPETFMHREMNRFQKVWGQA